MFRTTRVFLLSASVVTLALTGCSSAATDTPASPAAAASSTGSPAVGPHNAADVAFARDMIPHHQQAVEMADMAARQASSTDVKTLAAQIGAAQAPEIATMSGWLTGWGEAVPSISNDHAGHDMGGMTTGMMSEDEMSALAAASGTAFDRMWLTMMIEHHTGAVTMARTELAEGSNPQARDLAQSIVSSQSAEIDRMRQLLGD